MKMYWTVRIYNHFGHYAHCRVETKTMEEIATVAAFYEQMTGCRMLMDGMNRDPNSSHLTLREAFDLIWETPANQRTPA